MIWMRYLSIWVCQLSKTHLINILKVNHWLRLQWLETSASGFHNTIIVNKCVEMNKMYKKWDRYKFNSNPVRHSWGHEEELSQFWDQWNTFVVCLKNYHFWGPRAANSIFFKTKEFDPLKWLNDEAMENYKLREHVFLKVNTRKSCKLPVRLDNNRIIWQNRPNTLLEIVCWQIGQRGDMLRRSPSCVWNGNVLSAGQRIKRSLFYRKFCMPWRLNQSHFLLLKPGLKVSHLMLSI